MNKTKKYQGVIVPMATPFTAAGKIDEQGACRIIDHLCSAGVAGVFVLGTTGESASIATDQKKKMADITVKHTNRRAMTYAGISDNCFDNSVAAAKTYFDLGIDAVVAHVPCYYSLGDDEICRYYAALAEAVDGPLMLYNIPKTTNMSISIEAVEKLSSHRRIVGLKDSANDPARMEKMLEKFAGRDDFSYVLGFAPLGAKAFGLGADGIVPSTGNLVPAMYQQLFEKARQGNHQDAQKLQELTNQVSSVYQANRSLGQSLAALKMMMSIVGLCGPTMLPPLETLGAGQKTEIENQMRKLDVFNKP